MPSYNFIARDRSGQQFNDFIESPSREAAIAQLRSRGLLALKITELQTGSDPSNVFSLNPLDYRPIRSRDIEHEFHQIAMMLRSGISLLDALNMTARYARIGTRKTWQALARRIQQGSSFTDALAEHPVFTQFTIQLIRVGEQTGHLYTVIDQAAQELTDNRKLKKKIFKALRYPAFTLLMSIGIVAYMLTKVIPEIKKFLLIMGKPMPPITQALMDVSDWFLSHGVFLFIVAVAFAVSFFILYQQPLSRWWIDKLALYVPVFGHVFRLSGTVLFSRAMGLLLRSGVVMVDALATMEKLHVNKYLAGIVRNARTKVMQGLPLSEQLMGQFGYMPLMMHMLRVGESSGNIDEILLEMTEYHDELLQNAVDTLTGMIAPAMTIIVGGVIGFVYAAFLVAMFSAAGGSPS